MAGHRNKAGRPRRPPLGGRAKLAEDDSFRERGEELRSFAPLGQLGAPALTWVGMAASML